MEEGKNFRRFAACFGAGILGTVALLVGFVYLVDPFYHYHAPYLDMPVILDNAVYQTAGAAKNLQYDSAIVGTSMTENMSTAWFDEELGWNTMKLSYSGARTDDLKAIFEQIEQKEGELKYVVMDINSYQLTSPSWTSYAERPHYLYDNHLYNDYQYVYNHDILVLTMQRVMAIANGATDNIGTAYSWGDIYPFSKEIALDACRETRAQLIGERPIDDNLYIVPGTTSDQLEESLQTCQSNLDNILPFIEAHPETEFWIMVPPYSMLYWEQEVLKGSLEDVIAIYAFTFETLLSYDNVKVYYFQNEQEIITNLDNYKDNAHHKTEFNRYMFDCMKEDKNLLTEDNYKQELEKMYDFAKDYPYETLWEE